MVCTRCFTFNHAPYIVDAMNGFTMQETTFPVVTVIVDDASSDGEQDVIRKYLDEHFQEPYRTEETDYAHIVCANHRTNPNCQFVVLFLKFNHYSVKKTKHPYLSEWLDNAKYHALCEGDDYWTDHKKLQKQVDVLNDDSKVSMCCSACKRYSVSEAKFKRDIRCLNSSDYLNPKTIITMGGLYIPTCSIVYRKDVVHDYPVYCTKCHVGDYPLQIMCAMKGKCYYINEELAVYRVENQNSWVGKRKIKPLEEIINGARSEVNMLCGFLHDYPLYKKAFRDRIAFYINMQLRANSDNNTPIIKEFSEEIKDYSLFWRCHLMTKTTNSNLLYIIFYKLFGKDLDKNFA